MSGIICNLCNHRVLGHSYKLQCSLCATWCHVNCLHLFTRDDYERTRSSDSGWSCPKCNECTFPFNQLDDQEFTYCLTSLRTDDFLRIHGIENMLFSPYEMNDIDLNNPCFAIDPDSQYLNTTTATNSSDCKYYTSSSLEKEIINLANPKPFSVFHLNIRSAPKNLSELNNFLSTLAIHFTCIGLTETWISNNTSSSINISGYSHIHKFRDNRRGGGVSLFLNEGIPFFVRDDLTVCTDLYECLFVEIDKQYVGTDKNIVAGVIYRIPGTDIKEFNIYFRDTLNVIKRENRIGYLMGDFNINLLNYNNHNPTNDFVDAAYSQSFFPLITRPTRITQFTSTLIDNIFTNDIIDNDFIKGIFINDTSDHLPVFCVRLDKVIKPEEYMFTRCFSTEQHAKFRTILGQTNLDHILTCEDPNTAMNAFQENICFAYNKAFPIMKTKRGYKTKKPWLSKSVKESIKRKNNMYFALLKDYNTLNEITYKRYKAHLNKLMRSLEKKYYLELLDTHKFNMKKTWDVIKEVINSKSSSTKQSTFEHNGNLINDPLEISNRFNNYFTAVGSNLAANIGHVDKSPTSFMKGTYDHSLFLSPTNDEEVTKILLELKNSSPGYDGISIKVLKSTRDIIIPLLVHIINTSLQTGIFPDNLKIANIIPLFKAGKANLFTNYRPVSLLTAVSKVFEKVFYIRLYRFLMKYNILYDFQFGFRKDHSTALALLTLLDKVITSIENNEISVGIFLDFSKAFDTVNHDILIDKLHFYGVRGVPLLWIRSYLTERQQFTTYNGVSSAKQHISCGVPQGSILGPLLFLIYVNDLAYVSQKMFTLMFADDTSCFMSGKDIDTVVSSLNIELQEIVVWLKANRLSLNIAKTHYIIFSSKRKNVTPSHDIHIEGNSIVQVNSCKFLGVMIDGKLSWQNHIDYIKQKIAKVTGVLYRARSRLSTEHLIKLYNALVIPYLYYCNIIWSVANVTVLNPLSRMQKQAIRCICFIQRRTSTDTYFKKLALLKLDEIAIYARAMFMYKYYNNKLPSLFNAFYNTNCNIHLHQTRQCNMYHLPPCKSELSKRFIKYTGAVTWNQISTIFDVNVKPSTFKKHLKTFILKK